MSKVTLRFDNLEDPVDVKTIYREKGQVIGFVPGWRFIFKKDSLGNVYATEERFDKMKSQLLDDNEYKNFKNLLDSYDSALESTERNLLEGKEFVYLVAMGLEEHPYIILTKFEIENLPLIPFREKLINAYNQQFGTNFSVKDYNEFVSLIGKNMEDRLPQNIQVAKGKLESLPKVELNK